MMFDVRSFFCFVLPSHPSYATSPCKSASGSPPDDSILIATTKNHRASSDNVMRALQLHCWANFLLYKPALPRHSLRQGSQAPRVNLFFSCCTSAGSFYCLPFVRFAQELVSQPLKFIVDFDSWNLVHNHFQPLPFLALIPTTNYHANLSSKWRVGKGWRWSWTPSLSRVCIYTGWNNL